jgi:hypothetical protein
MYRRDTKLREMTINRLDEMDSKLAEGTRYTTQTLWASPQGISGGPWPDDRQPTQQVRGVATLSSLLSPLPPLVCSVTCIEKSCTLDTNKTSLNLLALVITSYCVGWRSSGQEPPLIPCGEAHNLIFKKTAVSQLLALWQVVINMGTSEVSRFKGL